MKKPRITYITKLVSYWLSKTNQLSKAPVDIKKIAAFLDIKIIEDIMNADISGIAIKNNYGKLIIVRKSDHKNRKRFTIAHEIGHHLLHSNTINFNTELYRNPRSSLGNDTKEIEANFFAASILMPELQIRKFISNSNSNINPICINNLAKNFLVSSKAMTIRLNYLSIKI